MQEYLTRVSEIKYLTQHVLELSVDLILPDTILFKAGQFMQFILGPQQFRSYSIVSVPDHNRTLKFCVELVPGGAGSAFVKSLSVGSEVKMRGPLGVMTFDFFERDACFIAGGVGIAPYASMIPDMLSRGYSREAHLLFGVRNEENVFYFDRFNHLATMYQNFKFTPILSRPEMHWPGEVGRVTTYLDVAYERYRDRLFYICGGMDLVKDVRSLLLRKGHKPTDIKLEIFV